ncbi:MAG: copper chaperone PCu(A)C [Marinobacter sp.]|uniref:DR1885-like metal-binding protein n=2 Tax=Marinobacter adhaerens TaxID=1033846 RepID=E4PR75_MARAH|nr:DR1885-like metal-binding protein [Marinobacter adhaerens HP15]MAM52493.1 copper chaperone PCu(A)C [Marinobacter sp.]PHS49845.1 MAG: copper chaperone PCu(A)C [Marinobacter sp.]
MTRSATIRRTEKLGSGTYPFYPLVLNHRQGTLDMKYCLSVFVLALALVAPTAFAHDYSHGPVTVDHPWSRPTPPGTPMGVGYMSISNSGSSDITLVGAATPRAGNVSIHETSMHDGVMRMAPVKGGLAIPAGTTVELKPHSFHLMLEKLKSPLREGESIPLTLTFEGADEMQVELNVESLDGEMMKSESMDHSGKSMDHSGH